MNESERVNLTSELFRASAIILSSGIETKSLMTRLRRFPKPGEHKKLRIGFGRAEESEPTLRWTQQSFDSRLNDLHTLATLHRRQDVERYEKIIKMSSHGKEVKDRKPVSLFLRRSGTGAKIFLFLNCIISGSTGSILLNLQALCKYFSNAFSTGMTVNSYIYGSIISRIYSLINSGI